LFTIFFSDVASEDSLARLELLVKIGDCLPKQTGIKLRGKKLLDFLLLDIITLLLQKHTCKMSTERWCF
jgi:hypothetical protein